MLLKSKKNELSKDIADFESFTAGKKKTFDAGAFKRLVLSELSVSGAFGSSGAGFCGFRRGEIKRMCEEPERYGKKLIRLSNVMYLRSGYYRRLIDYFAGQALLCATVDTLMLDEKTCSVDKAKLGSDFAAFSRAAEGLGLRAVLYDIMKRLYKTDVCFAYTEQTGSTLSYFFLDPAYCEINAAVNGNVLQFAVNRRALSPAALAQMPEGLREIIGTQDGPKAYIPLENSLCLKYNSDTAAPVPPFFPVIADILLIDEFKELAKAKSVNDAYKLLTMKIPTKDGEITLDDGLISEFTSLVLSSVPSSVGIITTPFEMKSEEFSSVGSKALDNVSEAASWVYKNAGVSEALMSSAGEKTGLTLSVIKDAADIFRLYRQLESWAALRLGGDFGDYAFRYSILDVTALTLADAKQTELNLARCGLPNKLRLCALSGMSPAAALGNGIVENEVFGELTGGWRPLRMKYLTEDDR